MIPLRCPHCGKELMVPEDAEKVVCLFCAKPIEIRQNREKQREGCERALSEAAGALGDEVFSYRIPMDSLTVAKYPVLFAQYEKLLETPLNCFQSAARLEEETAVEGMASLLFDGFRRQIRQKTRSGVFDCRFTITSLMIPAILQRKDPAAEKTADRFLEKWKAEFPGQPLGKADYDSILRGFRRKLCFITTAVCRSLKKGDSCEELQAFRNFRDGWLAASVGGPQKNLRILPVCPHHRRSN